MWVNYIRGVVACLKLRGLNFSGMDIAVSGDVPQGAGLSSSAALEVVIGQTFKELYQLELTQADVALIGQQAENEFVGCNCGIMDQLISAEGKTNHALLIDCESLQTTPVSMPKEMAVMIINSNKKRGLVDSEYNTRRQQCEEAAKILNVPSLRHATMDDLQANQTNMSDNTFKRARHVITENQRVLDAVAALCIGDMKQVGQLMQASHLSMRDDFEITVPEIDLLVTMVKVVIGDQGGVRMTGGGFGGCVVALVPFQLVDEVTQTIQSQYETQTGLKEAIYICQAENGAGLVGDLICS